MKSLYEKLTEKSRPVEIAVGKKLEQVSKKYYYEVEDQTMDYDVCLVNSENGKSKWKSTNTGTMIMLNHIGLQQTLMCLRR